MTITVGGSNITFPDSTTQTTAFTGGGVTSAVAGNGVAVSGATGAVTFSASAPSYNTVGSYAYVAVGNWSSLTGLAITGGSNYSAGGGNANVQSAAGYVSCGANYAEVNNLSGTWKWMGTTASGAVSWFGIAVRVA